MIKKADNMLGQTHEGYLFITLNIFTCQTRKSTEYQDLETEILTGIQASLISLFTPVLFLMCNVRMSSVKKAY